MTAGRKLDLVVSGAIVFLIVFTPMAIGSVHPPQFSLMEIVIFLLVIAWMVRLALGAQDPPAADAIERGPAGAGVGGFRALALPAALFLLLVGFELCPLPPALLRIVSPATYRTYSESLIGYPDSALESAHLPLSPIDRETGGGFKLSAPKADAPGAPVFSAAAGEKAAPRTALGGPISPRWLALAIAPELTRTAALKALAYAGLFFLVVCYPFGDGRDRGGSEAFIRTALIAVLGAALLVALVGLAEREYWNGRILWFYLPRDWGGAPQLFYPPRASGPFINPDHFANYLAVVLPIGLAAALMRSPLFARRWQGAAQIACAAGVFIVFCAILLSLSRGGWIGAGIGICLVFVMLFSSTEIETQLRRSPLKLTRARVLGLAAAAGLVLVLSALAFVGETARMQADTRLGETVTVGVSLWERLAVWRDSFRMIHAFPLLGVGLGGFSEALARFVTPPWSQVIYREAHNDYIQLLAETGIVGFALAGWFFYRAGRILWTAPSRVPARLWPVFAGIAAALVVMAFHETVDFNLHEPANALLFTLLLGIGVRMVLEPQKAVEPAADMPQPSSPMAARALGAAARRAELELKPAFAARGGFKVTAAAVSLVSIALIFAALRQKGLPYPYDIANAATPGQARETILRHPADPHAHLTLVALSGPALQPKLRLALLRSAVWLGPINPLPRDLYAEELLRQGHKGAGLAEIARSLKASPPLSSHFYLSPPVIPWLGPDVSDAVERGLRLAMAGGEDGAASQLAIFYQYAHRYGDEAAVLASQAARTRDPKRRSARLVDAGNAYLAAGDYAGAEKMFFRAAQSAPQSTAAYSELALSVFTPQHKMDAAKAAIERGINNGADPFVLSTALASAYDRVNDHEKSAAALEQALSYRPWDLDATFKLAQDYLVLRHNGRAIVLLQRALDSNPGWAVGYYLLAKAERGDYQFSAADRDFRRAIALDPKDRGMREEYNDFRKRLAQNAPQEPDSAADRAAP